MYQRLHARLPMLRGATRQHLTIMKSFGQKIADDGVLQFAGMLAYSLLLAVAPLLLGLVGVLTVLFFVTGHTSADLVRLLTLKLSSVVPASGARSFAQAIQQNAGAVGLIGVVTAIIAGAGFFMNVAYVLSIIYRLQPRPFIKGWLMAAGMTLVLIPLIVVMVLATSVPQALASLAASNGAPVASSGLVSWLLAFAGGVAAAFLLFSAVYVIVPNQQVRPRDVFAGALLAAVLLECYTLIFPLYAGHFLKTSNYGTSMGFALVAIVFFYYFAVILLIGAEFNSWLLGQRDLRGSLPDILHQIEQHAAEVRPAQPVPSAKKTRPTASARPPDHARRPAEPARRLTQRPSGTGHR